MNVRQGVCAGVGVVVVAIGVASFGGDLGPPPGVVAPTMKTLREIEPRVALSDVNTPGDAVSKFRIAAPGSYYLTGSLGGEAMAATILIDSDDVTLDLMGFRLTGAPTSVAGVSVAADRRNVVILNGVIASFVTGIGIDAGPAAGGIRIEGVEVRACSVGIDSGPETTMVGCAARECAELGIRVGSHSIVRECISCGNGAEGFVLGEGAIAESCAAASNSGNGFDGSEGAVIRGCTARSNEGDGIRAGSDALVSECTVVGNAGDGIAAEARVLIRLNIVHGNEGDGIEIGCYGLVTGNIVYVNEMHGIRAAAGWNTIDGNKLAFNMGDGIRLDSTLNVVVRNDVTGDEIVNVLPPNTVGALNDMYSPWSNLRAN